MEEHAEELSKKMAKSDNKYVLVHAVAKRAKKIIDTSSQSNIEISSNRAIVTALQEIAAEENY
ncbi:MAG: DNA-directed RNA polymerase subunit omega [Candidatus Sericytochromatia bacterium]